MSAEPTNAPMVRDHYAAAVKDLERAEAALGRYKDKMQYTKVMNGRERQKQEMLEREIRMAKELVDTTGRAVVDFPW